MLARITIILSLLIISFLSLLLFPSKILAQTNLPTIEDYWNGSAYFEFQNKFTLPTSGSGYDWAHMNMGTDIVVKDGVWYMFTREYTMGAPSYCSPDTFHAYIVVRSSTDKGQTWTNKTKILDIVPNSAQECALTDGDGYYDWETNTWHYLYQCIGREHVWRICHASRQADNPFGGFTLDQNNPVVDSTVLDTNQNNSSLWYKICPEGKCLDNERVKEEGTPEIVEKRDGYYYVTFHGAQPFLDNGVTFAYGYRGAARTRDFVHWETINNGPIHDRNDCQGWNVPWGLHGCIGGGQATILKEGNYYYMLVESVDISLNCTVGQNWVYGLVRSTSLSSTSWENYPQGDPIIFNSQEKNYSGTVGPCGVQYSRIFKDEVGETYLLFGRLSPRDPDDTDSLVGIYLYKLKRKMPFASYQFREGPNHEYTNSDIISSGNLEAKTSNVQWLSDSDGTWLLSFNGNNSLLSVPSSPLFYPQTNKISLKIRLNLNRSPTTTSALVAGKPGSYWLEYYRSGNFCFWAVNSNGSHGACYSPPLNQWLNLKAFYDSSTAIIAIYQNGSLVAANHAPGQGINQNDLPFKLGNLQPQDGGYYGSMNAWVGSFNLFGNPPRGDFNGDDLFNDQDFNIFFRNWITPRDNSLTDTNNDGVTNSVDYSLLLNNPT